MLTVTTWGRALGGDTRDPAQQVASSLGVGWQTGKGLTLTLVPACPEGTRASGTMTRWTESRVIQQLWLSPFLSPCILPSLFHLGQRSLPGSRCRNV